MNLPTIETYLNRVTPWQANPIKARFLATVRANVQPYVDAQALIASMPGLFDLDAAVGDQLDKTGEWIGQRRGVPVPLANIYFSADVAPGADEGYAQGPFGTAYSTSLLPDPFYRRLLYARILYNGWDGTPDDAVTVTATYFDDPATLVFVDDQTPSASPALYFAADDATAGADIGTAFSPPRLDVPERLDVRWVYGIAGKIPSQVDLAILRVGILPPRPMGATVEIAVTTVDGAPLFGADMDNAYVAGADIGAADNSPAYVADLIAA